MSCKNKTKSERLQSWLYDKYPPWLYRIYVVNEYLSRQIWAKGCHLSIPLILRISITQHYTIMCFNINYYIFYCCTSSSCLYGLLNVNNIFKSRHITSLNLLHVWVCEIELWCNNLSVSCSPGLDDLHLSWRESDCLKLQAVMVRNRFLHLGWRRLT